MTSDDLASLFDLLDYFRGLPDDPPPTERPGLLFVESDDLDVVTTFPWTADGRREAIAWVEDRVVGEGAL